MGKPISKLNKEWHLAHRMPKNATMEERIAWHIEHSKHCSCRSIPDKLKQPAKREKLINFLFIAFLNNLAAWINVNPFSALHHFCCSFKEPISITILKTNRSVKSPRFSFCNRSHSFIERINFAVLRFYEFIPATVNKAPFVVYSYTGLPSAKFMAY